MAKLIIIFTLSIECHDASMNNSGEWKMNTVDNILEYIGGDLITCKRAYKQLEG